MNNFVLYLHITPNGKKYFGITGTKPEKRWLRGEGYKKQYFYKAVEEFGWDNIKHYILADDLTRFEARMFEIMMIAIYDTTNLDNGYNDSPGGGIISEEARQKISETLKGRKLTEDHKQKLSKAFKGRKLTEEWKQKIGEANKNRVKSEEWKNFLSESQKGIKNNCVRPVICLTTKRMFITTVDAAKYYNLKQPNVTNCCIGKTGKRRCKSAGKTPDGIPMKWKYLNHKHNNMYHVAGKYYVDNEKIIRLIEESFPSEDFNLDSWDLFDNIDNEPIDYENLPDII